MEVSEGTRRATIEAHIFRIKHRIRSEQDFEYFT